MFVFPHECKSSSEWLEKTMEKTATWADKCAYAVVEEVENGDDVLRRAVTLERAKAMVDMLEDVKKAYAEFDSAERS